MSMYVSPEPILIFRVHEMIEVDAFHDKGGPALTRCTAYQGPPEADPEMKGVWLA